MTREEAASCINTIVILKNLCYRVRGLMDVIDAQNCDKIIEMLNTVGETHKKHTETHACDTISRQAALAETVHSEREEVTMGYLKEKHGVMMLGKTPEGTCPECAVKHDPRYPHDRNSLTYQYKFYDQHGRWPTWADAMAHCDEAMREAWTEALKERGVEV